MSASRKVAAGVAYTLVANYAVRFINLAVTIVVARAVGPAGMGIVAAAMLTVEIIDTIRDFGLREALIYKADISDDYSNSAFFVIQAVSMVQAAAMVAVASLGEHYGLDPQLGGILIWLAILFPLSALGSPQEAMLQRQGAFGRRALADMVGVVVKAVIAVILVHAGWGVWSVVAAMLTGVASRTLTLWLQSRWVPRITIPSLSAIVALIRYGKHIIAVNIMALFRQKADQFVVAAMLGPSQLGAYFLAARIPEMAIYGVNVAISTVAFPTFSRIVREGGDLRLAYLRAVRASMLLMVPVAVGIAATADQIVPVFFGALWQAAVPVLGILALGGIPLTLGWSAGDIFKATGRPELLSTVSLIEVVATTPIVATVVVLSGGHLTWVSATMVACETGSCILRLFTMQRYAATSILRTLSAVAPILGSAAVMGVTVHFAAGQMGALGPVLRLACSVLLGAGLFAALILIFDRASVEEVRQLVRQRSSGPGAADPAPRKGRPTTRTLSNTLAPILPEGLVPLTGEAEPK